MVPNIFYFTMAAAPLGAVKALEVVLYPVLIYELPQNFIAEFCRELASSRLQSSFRHISRIIKANRMHLTTICRIAAKDVNAFVNNRFLFLLAYFLGENL